MRVKNHGTRRIAHVLRSGCRSRQGPELARTKWSVEVLGDWDISPDGLEVAIPNHDSRTARIRVVSLEPKPNQPREQEVLLAGVTDLRGVVWAADGQGWFVSVDTTVGNRLLYVYLDGRFHRWETSTVGQFHHQTGAG